MNIQFLETKDQLLELLGRSKTEKQYIFKHSTRCGISMDVLDKITSSASDDFKSNFFVLDLLNNRELSSEIAILLKVLHQSPQLLAINNEECVGHLNHYAINYEKTLLL
jgi:bacillithiol system protein YtxJ